MPMLIVARTVLTASLVFAAVLASGCSQPAERYQYPTTNDENLVPAVAPDEAADIARTALEGLNAGRYDLFTTRWSASLTGGISEEVFQKTRQQLLDQVGPFQAIEDVRLNAAKTPDHVRYAFRCTFARGEKVLVDVYPTAGTEIVGAYIADPNAN